MSFCTAAGPPVVREAVYHAAGRDAARTGRAARSLDSPTTLLERFSARSTWPASIGSFGNTITRCKAAASSSRWSAWPTMGRATRPWCGRCSSRGADW